MSLRVYIIKRILQTIPLLFGVSLLIFVIVRSAPGDPITILYGQRPGIIIPQSEIERIKTLYGLNDPLYVQYVRWMMQILHGDFGWSFVYSTPVSQLIYRGALNTLKMQVLGFLISLLIAIPTGVISAVKYNTKTDYAVMMSSLFFCSIPYFWYSMILILVFSSWLQILPSHGMGPVLGNPTFLESLSYLVLPVTVIGTGGSAFMARLLRSSMLEVLGQDYVMTARAKGLKERIVIYHHALRNALLPLVTVVGLYLAFLISGSAVVEYVFAWPGLGTLIVDAATFRDYPVVLGVTLVVSIIVVLSILITDIAYAFLDPRVRFK